MIAFFFWPNSNFSDSYNVTDRNFNTTCMFLQSVQKILKDALSNLVDQLKKLQHKKKIYIIFLVQSGIHDFYSLFLTLHFSLIFQIF